MKKIVVDLLNNDNGEIEAIKAVNRFANENKNYTLYIVGTKQNIDQYLDKKLTNVVVKNNNEIVSKLSENIREILSKNSSMLESFEILNDENADGILSSGDSGSFITMATLKIRRIKNITRPAFMPIVPSQKDNHKYLLLDAGANLNIKEEYLLHWGLIATEFYKLLFNKQTIKLGILNIGTEQYKGIETVKNSYTLFNKKLMDENNIDFVGFIEPKNIIQGDVDVALADGYAGNLFLKTLESSFMTFAKILKNIFMSKFKNKIAALLVKKDIKKFKEKFDYRNTGGAFVIGLEKLVVKAHGGSDELAFYNALNQLKLGIENNITTKLINYLSKLGDKNE